MMRMTRLRELARLYSIQLTYDDATGKKRYATREALEAALRVRTGGAKNLTEALRARKRSFWERGVEPVTIVWGKQKPSIPLRLTQNASIDWQLALEDGTTREGRAEPGPVEWREEEFLGTTVNIDETVPHGYHSLRITIGGRTLETFVIAAPGKAYAPPRRTWGAFAPLYAAHTRRSWGAGDLGDLLAYTNWIHDHGGGIVATLPMLAAFADEPSPYSPHSRLFWNELYLDVTRLPEFTPEDLDHGAIAHLQQTRDVDYDGVHRLRRRVLERLAQRFVPDDGFAQFEPHAREYAEFRARQEQRDSARYHLYVQYRMAQQLREVADAARHNGLGLYLDFPLGVNPGGYDAWRYAEQFAKGISVGAPPDAFFTKGQNWGFAPFDPDAIREHRYDYFRAAIRNHVAHAGVLRIDHVMGLHRLYWIPEGAEAKDGLYVRYPEEELYAILTLESTRHRCAIVGEDLGTVPPAVPKMMAKHGLRRMFVVQYEVKPGDPPMAPPPKASMASINTHDMPTYAAFWNGQDVDDRVKMGLLDQKGARSEQETREQVRRSLSSWLAVPYDARKTLEALLEKLAASDAEMVLVNLEDLWGESEPQNVPGVPGRSWRHKFREGLEDAQADGSITRVFRVINTSRDRMV